MEFVLQAKNFKLKSEETEKLNKSISNLSRALKSFGTLEKPGTVRIEKMSNRTEFKAKISFHVPKHTISTNDFGYSPEEAVHKAAADAKDLVIKIKDRLKDTHERRRRSKITSI